MIALWMGVALAHAPGTSWSELRAHTLDATFTDAEAAERFATGVTLDDASGPCRGQAQSREEAGLVLVRVEHRCQGPTTIRWESLQTLEPGHRHLTRGQDKLVVLSATSPAATARPALGSWWERAAAAARAWWG